MQTHLYSFLKFYLYSYQGLTAASWRGVIMTLIDSTLIGIYYFLSFYFMNDLHFSITTCGIIVSCHGIGSIAGARFGGKLSDITSPTLVSAISLLLQAIGYLALTILHTPASIMIDAFILGAASYGFITSNHMWTLQHCTNGERLKAINLLSTASNLGFSLSAILMGTIISFGFHHLFIFVSSITLLMSSYLFIRAKSIRKLPTLTESCASNHKHAQHHHCTQPHRQIIIYVMLTCVLMTGITVSQLSSTYPIYVQHQFPSMGVQSFSILFAINSLLVVMLEAPLGSLFVKHNKILILGLGALLIGVGMCLLTISLVFSLAAYMIVNVRTNCRANDPAGSKCHAV